MKVTSPMGDFPHTLARVTLQGRQLVVHGRMSARPAKAELGARDLLELARLTRVPLLLAGAVGLILLARRLARQPSVTPVEWAFAG